MSLRTRTQRRRLIAAITAGLLAVSLTEAATFAAAATPNPTRRPSLGKPIPVRPSEPASVAGLPSSTSMTLPTGTVLSPGSTSVDLSSGGSANAGDGITTRAAAGRSTPAAQVRGDWQPVASGLDLAAAATSAASATRSRVTVRVLSAVEAKSKGLSGPVFELRRTDAATSTSIAMRLDPGLLAGEFGADYAGRTQWVQLPETQSAVPSAMTAIASSSPTSATGSTVLTPTVGNTAVLVVPMSSPTSTVGGGSFGASPVRPSSTWQVSAQTGDFSWSYPMRVPPTPAGPSPSIALNYSEQSVDGETGVTNNQPSDVGEGWSLAGGGSISRSYASCAIADGTRAAILRSGDLCYSTDNATISVAGHSGSMIRDSSGTWKLSADDGSRVQYQTGASNGTSDGGYWVLTTTDGTRYFFGINGTPSGLTGSVTTNSAWTVPVCGNATTACTGSFSTAAPFSTQAWQWNLDFVVDPHNNVEVLKYTPVMNKYAEKTTTAVTYTRGGQLTEIDYGIRGTNVAGTTAASGKAVFGYVARCETGQSGEPANACSPTAPVATWWPDVPWDLNCTAATCTETSPSFWSSAMLSTVTTQVLSGTSYATVESWTLSHSWPATGSTTQAPALWLTQVAHSAGAGATLVTLTTTFAGTSYENRVAPSGFSTMNKYRINVIHNDTGGIITVTYAPEQCTAAMVPALTASPNTNTNRCFPSWWTPSSGAARLDWFQKHIVTAVVEDPHTGGTTDIAHETDYIYTGTPAWRFNEAPGVPDNQRTWSDWAGYSSVEVRVGAASNPAAQQTTDYTYFQGLNGDANGTVTSPTSVLRTQTFPKPGGGTVNDELWWAGRVYQKVVHVGSSGGTSASTTPVLSTTTSIPWASPPTATSTRTYNYTDPSSGTVYTGTLNWNAYLTGDGTATTTEPLSTGGNRTNTTTTTQDSTYGRVTQVENVTSDAGSTCTKTDYATNTTDWLINYPSRVLTLGVSCSATPTYPASTTVTGADVISDTGAYYDGNTTLGVIGTTGEVRQTAVAIGYSGSTPTWRVNATATYDALGRIASATDPLAVPAATTSTAYTPAAGGPLTQTVVTNPKSWTTTTTYLPAWGAKSSVTDVNGNITTAAYDVLGRVTGVWLPNRPQASNPTSPSTAYAYTTSTSVASTVATTAVTATGTTTTSYALFDGLGQMRQTQAPSEGGGRVLTDAFSDSLGQKITDTKPYYATGNPSGTLMIPTLTLPALTDTTYDGAGRVTASILLKDASDAPGTTTTTGPGTLVWQTTSAYSGADRTDTVPPSGGTPTSTFVNSRGKTTSLVQYLSSAISGTTETTGYGYNQRGDLTAMTNPAGSAWSWTYNVLGQQIKAVDPGTGTTTSTYTDDGQLATTSDNTSRILAYTYDQLGRKTAVYSGSTSGVQLSTWSYDTATLGKGLPVSSTRYVGGAAGIAGSGTPYTTSTSGYTTLGSPNDATVTIGGTTALAGSYKTSFYYGNDGTLTSQVDPAEGGLPSETLRYGYDGLGEPTGLSSASALYLGGVTYDHINEPAQLTQIESGTQVTTLDFWNASTGRMDERQVLRQVSSGGVVSDDYYTYDNAGELLEDNNLASAATDTQCYGYDHLGDLTSAWTPASNSCTASPTSSTLGGPAPYWTSYSIDAATGNRLSVTQHATTGTGTDTRDTYNYPTSGYLAGGKGGPNAMTSVTHASAPAGTSTWTTTSTDSYSYDAVGSTTTLPGMTVAYDSQGLASSSTLTAGTNSGSSQSDVYTADGTLLLQSDPVSGTTAFLGDTELHAAAGSTLVSGTRTYTAAGLALAERDTQAGVTGSTLYFLDVNPNGTATANVTVGTSAVTARYLDPYGNPRATPPAWTSDHGFLNAPINPFTTATGAGTSTVTHLGARDYDAMLGRFLTVDPVLDPGNPQQDNGYSYGWNNPLTNADSTGLDPSPRNCTTTECRNAMYGGEGSNPADASPVGDCIAANGGDAAACHAGAAGPPPVDPHNVMITFTYAKTCGADTIHPGPCHVNSKTVSLWDLQHPTTPKNYCGTWSWLCTLVGYNQIRNCFAGQGAASCISAIIAVASDAFIVAKGVKVAQLSVDGLRALVGAGAADAAGDGGSEVLIDTSGVKGFGGAKRLLKPGEVPVICETVLCEAQAQGFSTGSLPVIPDGSSATLRARVAQQLRGFGASQQGLENDATIGATALERGIPLITGDKALYNAVVKLGGDARLFTPGG
jgi:RHS repeat-associated protein